MFPVGSLFLFHRPDLQEKLRAFGDSKEIIVSMGVPEEDIVKNIPRTREEMQAQIAYMRQAHQERVAAAAAAARQQE
ncbi:hypothetical protein HDU83_002428 [Entophlyctis luteolus]|nr:hypothetical protein HDU83_002428 [Entophlyctis luteolus]